MDKTLSPTEATLALLIFLPFLLLLLPGFMQLFDGFAFWIAMFSCASLIWIVVLMRFLRVSSEQKSGWRMLSEKDFPQAIKQVMQVDSAAVENGVKVFRGQLKELANVAHERLQTALPDNTVIMLPAGKRAAIMLVPKSY